MSNAVLSEIKVRAYILSKRRNIQAFLDSGQCNDPWQRQVLTDEVDTINEELLRPIPLVPGLHGGDGAGLMSA